MKYLILFLTIFCVRISAQNNTIDVFKPIPTVSYLSTYIDSPVDISTGVPKIDLPVFSLATKNKDVNINIDLSYHSKNAVRFQKASDVGLGWSLLNTNNVISKVVIGGPDEKDANNPQMNMDVFQFNDVFYFNAFGMSGKFVFKKNTDKTITIQNLGTSKEKIEFTNSTTGYFDILDFKITDEHGNQYFFNKPNEVIDETYGWRHKGAYYLTKVLDAANQELVTIEYAEYPYIDNHLSLIDYKPKKIISKDYGEMNIEYDYYPENRYRSNLTNMSDCYLIRKVELKDTQSRLLQQIGFDYGGFSYYKYVLNLVTYGTTTLDKFTRKDKLGNEIEAYSFVYNTTGTEKDYGPSPNFGLDVCPLDPDPIREWTSNPKYSTIGTLSEMILPTKGYVKFNFESNQYYFNRTSILQEPLTGTTIHYDHDKETQYYKLITSFNFNTKKNTTFNFNVTPATGTTTEGRPIIICFQVIGYDPNPLLDPDAIPNITFLLDNEPVQVDPTYLGRIALSSVAAGQHTITITGNTTGRGSVSISELTDTDVTHHNYKSKYGARIKSIQYFDSETSATPAKSKTYFYERFSDNETSSGELSPFISVTKRSDFITMYGDTELNKNIIYKNVKEVDADGGYSKYTFLGMYDPIKSGTLWYLDDINNRGLLSTKEIFNSSHQKIASENHEYTTEQLGNISFLIEGLQGYTTLYPVYIKKHKIINTTFFQQDRAITSSVETLVNKNDFNAEYTKASNADGTITETYYDYPYSKQITKLLNKNIYKNLIETKTVLNGKTISRTETKYDNAANLFPTSVISYDLQNTASTEVTYDQYDTNGNLQQYTTKDGISTAIIWGYNNTQPIAKIVGATYAQVSGLVATIISASNLDASAVPNNDESALLTTMDNLRKDPSMSNYQVTTYTYDPLIGVRSITPPSGIREIYIYDTANRLKEIRENSATGKLLKEFKYNYKN